MDTRERSEVAGIKVDAQEEIPICPSKACQACRKLHICAIVLYITTDKDDCVLVDTRRANTVISNYSAIIDVRQGCDRAFCKACRCNVQ